MTVPMKNHRGTFLVAGALLLEACGHCDGAVRTMRSQFGEWCPNKSCTLDSPPRLDGPEPVIIASDDEFRLSGDFRGHVTSAEILAASRVSERTWFLVNGASQPVRATLRADWGGHLCRNGVGFNLKPSEKLEAGDYTLVLLVSELAWPYVGDDPVARWNGRPAVLRRFRVN